MTKEVNYNSTSPTRKVILLLRPFIGTFINWQWQSKIGTWLYPNWIFILKDD